MIGHGVESLHLPLPEGLRALLPDHDDHSENLVVREERGGKHRSDRHIPEALRERTLRHGKVLDRRHGPALHHLARERSDEWKAHSLRWLENTARAHQLEQVGVERDDGGAMALRLCGCRRAENLEQRRDVGDLGRLSGQRAQRRVLLVALLELLNGVAQRVRGALVQRSCFWSLQLNAIASSRAFSSAADRGRFSRSFASTHMTSSDSA